jgi:N-acetylmuramoyl-L-alanine amidase
MSRLLVYLLIFSLCRPAAASYGIKYEYRQAQSSFEKLIKDSGKQNVRHPWLECLKKFRSVYTAQPDGPMADDALFMMGRLHCKLYEVSAASQDRKEGIDCYRRLLGRFPKSPYRTRAKEGIARLATEEKNKAAQKHNPKPQAGSFAEVRSLRFWSNPSYTRVVIDVDKEVPYTYRLLRKDPAIGKPQRLYVDVHNARMGGTLKPVVPIGDDLLSDARAAQYAPQTVRVVLDIKSIDKFKIFSLKNPFRIVLDVNGIRIRKKTSAKKWLKPRHQKPGAKIPKGALAKQLALGVSRIVIDPGHGGRDPGAIGYHKSVLEKNVTLEVAKRLAKKIRQRLGCEAILTRDRDVFVSLEERTAIANTKNADIFVSIHTNASRNRYSRGIETYFLNLATDHDAIMVAARENATSAKNISDLEAILNDLMKNAKVNESSRLAGCVQRALAWRLKPKYKRITDNGVKKAPFYVLLGAEMPCALVEVAFITNPKECRRLNTASYQEDVADAIVTGIKNYIKEISPAALTRARRVQARR